MKNKFGEFYLDLEKDIVVELYKKDNILNFILKTPNHSTGNLINNLGKLCDLKIENDENNLKILTGNIPSYIDGNNKQIYIFRLGNTKVANIYDDGHVEMKAYIPAISKTLMSQTKDYKLDISKTIIKTYILEDYKFHSDLHTHLNGILMPDILIALGIIHQIAYPLYYIKKLNLHLTKAQEQYLKKERKIIEDKCKDSKLVGKYLTRKIDDLTYINFADLILNNKKYQKENINKIRLSLSILKDGQAVFTNLEKVYLYRYIFTKGISMNNKIEIDTLKIMNDDIKNYVIKMLDDKKHEYKNNTLYQDKLLWIARTYKRQGINYVEISDTNLVKEKYYLSTLKQIHDVMPKIQKETNVLMRFLAAIRRMPLIINKEDITNNYLNENINVLKIVAKDPYVAGVDIVGEEVNDIKELKDLINEIVKIANKNNSFVIRIHAGENDSLRDNVYNSIKLIKDSLMKNQKLPPIRIGHGLFVPNLNSKKGKDLIKIIKENNVVLEFQITSNVRLNNLNNIFDHPLKKYLNSGIKCVQGTDGMALYGTNNIDEQLTLEKLLDLNSKELLSMKKTEEKIINDAYKNFKKKEEQLNIKLKNKSFEEIFKLDERRNDTLIKKENELIDSTSILKIKINEYPIDKLPIIIAGGSFNSNNRKTKINNKIKKIIDGLIDNLDPKKVFFVIGDSLSGYEKYLIKKNNNRFIIYAVVPSLINQNDINKYLNEDIYIRICPECFSYSLYKSFNYELFERRSTVVIAFDGNSAGANLIQEAKNGKHKSKIFVNENSYLKEKALSLKGYVTTFKDESAINQILETINDLIIK